MAAIFNFQSLLVVVLLLICTCAYFRAMFPAMMDARRSGPFSLFWKCARIGERLSPYVAVACFAMALSIILFD
eukprot:m.14522 g.14522  ORF g.14522 m.14522 type:complete len:73 (+) comp6443_c0_seq2:21-239(+)